MRLLLTSTRRLFAEYLRVVIDGGHIPTAINNPRRDLANELSERLAQVDFILVRVTELELEIPTLSDMHECGHMYFELDAESAARIELRVLTESFYYFAARVRSIARNSKFPLPGLGLFECRGVRDVRNKLLEHPEGGDSQVLIVSFGHGGPNGPTVKPIRRVGQEQVFPDSGLFPNAREFGENLDRLLQQALDQSNA